MPAQRRYGMDHEHYDWSPIVKRPVLRWPENARLAFCVVVNLEHMEWIPPEESYQSPNLAGGADSRPISRGFPDYGRLSHREYGHRVGIFRVLKVLGKHGIKPMIAMDVLTAEKYPYLVRYCLDAGCEIIGHGISVSQMITSKMSEQEEQQYIQSTVTALSGATGAAPVGWLGPEFGESTRTPQLLAAAGIRYVCDWANDEQPYRMNTSSGELFALPIMFELDDINALWDRWVHTDRYVRVLKEAFDTLYEDGEKNGRLLVLNLHPWLIGQPYRVRYLDEALGYVMGHKAVWSATGSQIVDWYGSNSPINDRSGAA